MFGGGSTPLSASAEKAHERQLSTMSSTGSFNPFANLASDMWPSMASMENLAMSREGDPFSPMDQTWYVADTTIKKI